MKKKLVSITLIVALALTTLSGCGVSDERFKGMSKNDIITQYQTLEAAYTEMTTKYSELETVLSGIQSEDAPTAAISITGDGTERLTFNSTDSKIIFPTAFQYPGSEQIAPSGSINIIKNISVSPASTWIFKLNGATLELEHSSGISGTIKVGEIQSQYDVNSLQSEVLSPWFEGLPPSSINYKDIFIGQTKFGVQATTPTMIDSEDAFLRCGMLGYGTYSITYVFVYRGEQDITKDESIVNVINSIDINGSKVSVSTDS